MFVVLNTGKNPNAIKMGMSKKETDISTSISAKAASRQKPDEWYILIPIVFKLS